MPQPQPIQRDAVILHQRQVARGIYWLALDVGASVVGASVGGADAGGANAGGDEFPRPDPGQFVFLRVSEDWDPFLRRPMGVFGFRREGAQGVLEILYRVVGRGTEVLSRRRTGESIDVLGPLGRGFEIERLRSRLLVAGGMGIAPLAFLAEASTGDDVFILGCRSAHEFPVDFLRERIGIPLRIVTEDGSIGCAGLATDLAREVGREREWDVEIAAAGPPAMLRALADLCEAHDVRGQVSLEARMACGLGSCLGCAVPVRSSERYLRACREGPVFEARDICWEALP